MVKQYFRKRKVLISPQISEMKDLIHNFPGQLAEALKISQSAELSESNKDIRNVVIAGMGGSGIGATIVHSLILDSAVVPVCILKDYTLPVFTDEHTLFIASSYSGNTEETLEILRKVSFTGAKITVISSGGEAIHTARSAGYDHIIVPGGMPPRSCVGYSIVQLLKILEFHEVCSDSFLTEIRSGMELLIREQEDIRKLAAETAQKLNNSFPVIYSDSRIEGIAIRYRQQLNENSKILCLHHVLPEMNHNELVGWTEVHKDVHVVILRTAFDHPGTQRRMEFTLDVIRPLCGGITQLTARGSNLTEQSLYHIHLADWISYELGILRNVDVMEVRVIDRLKNHLANA
jgi:glucose/mannose-6-phosphate isomerase